jgi:hypothetical protein
VIPAAPYRETGIGMTTREDDQLRAAERREAFAELDAIDAALDVIELRYGPDDVITETRRRARAVRLLWLRQANRALFDTVH